MSERTRELDELHEAATKCIRCGFCLEACPTFVLTGRETESPRGRIYLVRSAIEGQVRWDEDVSLPLESCLGCRACETACPSGVKYGQIFEGARATLTGLSRKQGLAERAKRAMLSTVSDTRKMRFLANLGEFLPSRKIPRFLGRLVSRGEEPEARIPEPERREWPHGRTFATTSSAYFLEGCAMDALFGRTNAATRFLLRRHGVEPISLRRVCCGALHLHAGEQSEARERAKRLISECRQPIPVITNSAGCGSAMKEYGHLLAHEPSWSESAKAFAARVRDISEFIAGIGFQPPDSGRRISVAYHDACHLAHGQGVRSQPRDLLRAIPGVELVELQESDRCCGSAGVYNFTHPGLARKLLDRKWQFIERSRVDAVVTGNPGCLAWIRQAAEERGSHVRVVHTARFLAESYLSEDEREALAD